MSRKPFSVVANVLAPDCNLFEDDENKTLSYHTNSSNAPGWPPFNGNHCKTLIGAVDYSWLFTYAIFLFISGLIADRVNLRYFLTIGMIGSGVCVGLLGVAYYAQIHNIAYFILVQIVVGVFESTGWPGVVAVMGNWFGKKRRGLLLGVWNAHTSVGNILGTAVPAIWAVPGKPWGWSFFVPAFVMIVVGIIVFFFLITDPAHVGLPPPVHHLKTPGGEDHTEVNGDCQQETATNGRIITNTKDNDDDVNDHIRTEMNGDMTHTAVHTSDHRKSDKDSTALVSETSFTSEDTTALIPAEDTGSVNEQVSLGQSLMWAGLEHIEATKGTTAFIP
jgi:hypothetical protein